MPATGGLTLTVQTAFAALPMQASSASFGGLGGGPPGPGGPPEGWAAAAPESASALERAMIMGLEIRIFPSPNLAGLKRLERVTLHTRSSGLEEDYGQTVGAAVRTVR